MRQVDGEDLSCEDCSDEHGTLRLLWSSVIRQSYRRFSKTETIQSQEVHLTNQQDKRLSFAFDLGT
jgi:hypothetical protein